ncbi:MAG: PDZ domain-containing protein [Planctomycetota bacterium]|jgi:hypothetical protein
MGGTKTIMGHLAAASAAFAAILVFAPTVRAEEGDLEARVRALEGRVEELAKAVEERDAEIARLREELEDRDAPRWPDPRGRAPGEPIERWRDQLGQLDEEMRRELERWGMDWGLPGRSFKRMPGPIELMPTRRAFLGIEMEEGDRGVQVVNVVAGSPAEEAGFKPGDLIVEIDGRQVFSADEIARLVGSRRPGDALTVTIERDGETLNLSATLAAPSGGRGRYRIPELRFGPFGRGRGLEPGEFPPGHGPARDTGQDVIDIDVPVPGGRARVRLKAPGLFLSEQLAKELGLTERERRHAEDALAEARGGLAGKLAEEVQKSGGGAETATVGRLRREAEAAARGLLAGKLPEAKLAALERAQAEAAAESSVSVSVRSSVGTGGAGAADDEEPGERRVEDPLEKLFERAQEF